MKNIKAIDETKKYFTHFNMEDTDVLPDKTYVLAKIVEPGFFDHITGENKDPVLSFKNVFVVKCLEVKTNVRYKNVDQKEFEYSMKTIKDIESLRNTIVSRYAKSMPRLTTEEIEKLGVAVATHEILERKTFTFS